eukprot:gnl/MRDRNA2_/MRDRNA2_37559_c0_seq2.p2 gnl/MRDRNA2_/MRDRNA2_37559_c0~~gnl/MRDRNA2_/MRDRNA2_37559_c0_seq2.p2  ORF type:complete len:106 (+),score=18.84 gnl/MRDRNA2_/MRDRNA2_37559_c0_seq2:327-644(+)
MDGLCMCKWAHSWDPEIGKCVKEDDDEFSRPYEQRNYEWEPWALAAKPSAEDADFQEQTMYMLAALLAAAVIAVIVSIEFIRRRSRGSLTEDTAYQQLPGNVVIE